MEKEIVSKKSFSKNFIIMGFASAACGAFHGFHDGMGIPLPVKSLETYLIFGPSIIQGIFGICDGISLAKKNKQIIGSYPDFIIENIKEETKNYEESKPLIKKELYGSVVGGIGAASGAFGEMMAGYMVGYVTAKIVKHFS